MIIKDKSAPQRLKGRIISFNNGIQAVQTESNLPDQKLMHFMGAQVIQCPYKECKKTLHPFMVSAKPCKHLYVGTRVVLTYVVVRDAFGLPVSAHWKGRLDDV